MVWCMNYHLSYIPPYPEQPDGTQAPAGIDVNFMHTSLFYLFKINAGRYVTKQFNSLDIDEDDGCAHRTESLPVQSLPQTTANRISLSSPTTSCSLCR